jgi:GAF domain-containing protein
VDDVPERYLDVRSGLGAAPPRSLILVPTVAGGTVNGVVELGFFSRPDTAVRELLGSVAETIGFATRSSLYRSRQAELLEESHARLRSCKSSRRSSSLRTRSSRSRRSGSRRRRRSSKRRTCSWKNRPRRLNHRRKPS